MASADGVERGSGFLLARMLYSIVVRELTVLVRRALKSSCENSLYSFVGVKRVLRDLTILNRPARTQSTQSSCEFHGTQSSCELSLYSFVGGQMSPARSHCTKSYSENDRLARFTILIFTNV